MRKVKVGCRDCKHLTKSDGHPVDSVELEETAIRFIIRCHAIRLIEEPEKIGGCGHHIKKPPLLR